MKKIVNRLQRIEGQVRALQGLIEEGTDCEKIVTQFKAAKSALDSCFAELMNENLQKCLANKDTEEMKKILKLLVKK